MIYFKDCPKCNGDVQFISVTPRGNQTASQEYKALQCVQCGFTVDNQQGKAVRLTNKS